MTRTTDFPPALVEDLIACLKIIFRQSDDPFCIVKWGDYYVQYLGRKEYGNLWFEAVSDFFLKERGISLSQEQKTALESIELLPPGMVTNNYSRFLPINDDADYVSAAQLGLSILRDIFGWRGEKIEIKCPLRDNAQKSDENETQVTTPPNPKQPQRGPNLLPCGQILGNINRIEPFLFVALEPRGTRFNSCRVNLGRLGIYVLDHETYPNSTRLAGFLLPIGTCRDDGLLQGLTEAAAILTERPVSQFRKERAVARLEAAGLRVTLKDTQQSPFACIALDGLADVLPRLGGVIDYVTGIYDDPNDEARITSTQPFPWSEYLPMLQWMYDGKTDLAWNHPSLFLVTGGVQGLKMWWNNRWVNRKVTSPELRLTKFFHLSENVETSHLSFTLKQEDYGWGAFRLTVGCQTIEGDLTEVYAPFEPLIEWVKRIDCREEAVAFAIDEEGPKTHLEVLATDDPNRVLFRVTQNYRETNYIQAIVDREHLVETFKTEILRFFRDEFSAERWNGDDPEIDEQMRQDILADPWFHTSKSADEGSH